MTTSAPLLTQFVYKYLSQVSEGSKVAQKLKGLKDQTFILALLATKRLLGVASPKFHPPTTIDVVYKKWFLSILLCYDLLTQSSLYSKTFIITLIWLKVMRSHFHERVLIDVQLTKSLR